MSLYLALKALHVIAVVVFLGNITTGLFWKAHADRTGDPRLMAHALDGIIRSDRWFTLPGVVAITVTGLAAAMIGGLPIFGTRWIWWSLSLFGLSGLAFGLRVAPLQVRLRRLATAGAEGGTMDWRAYHAASRAWEFWGAVALATPFAALVLMVLKLG